MKALRPIAQMPKEDRDAYRSANALQKQAMKLGEEGKHAEAQPLFEQMLAIRRRLLTDDHPITASSYSVVAAGLYPQGKYAEALTLYEKALELNRRLLTDDHPDTASSYTNLGNILHYLRNYRRAQPLLTKALELNRRLLTDDHPETARSQESLAENYYHEGKYQQAQPLFEKAPRPGAEYWATTMPTPPRVIPGLRSISMPWGSLPRPSRCMKSAGNPPPPATREPGGHRRILHEPGL